MSTRVWIAGTLAASSLLLAAALIAADRPDPQVTVVEEIIAKVNGDIVTRGELNKTRDEMAAELQRQGVSGQALITQLNLRSADALRDQIDQLLLVQKGKDLNINVDAEVNKRIAEVQSQSKESDPDKFHDWLQQMTGMSFEDFKLMQKNQLLTQRVIGEEIYRNLNIPKAEMQKYYDDHKKDFIREETVVLREILVAVKDPSPATVTAAEAKAKSLVVRAKGGEKFTDLARQFSDAPTAVNDGELGSFKKGNLRKEIDDIVFKQQKGYVSDPIRTPNGFEILRVEEHYPAGQATFDDVQGEISNIMSEDKARPKVRDYLTGLRQAAFLQVKAGYVDTGAAPGKDTEWKDTDQLKPETTTKEAIAAAHRKKLFKVIPYGHAPSEKDQSPAPPPAVTPVSNTPVTPKA
jgi:parvulin-like peptidyl-prolyl isomerase